MQIKHVKLTSTQEGLSGASLVAQMVKYSACNAGDPGSILGQEDTLEKGMATHSSVLA